VRGGEKGSGHPAPRLIPKKQHVERVNVPGCVENDMGEWLGGLNVDGSKLF